MSRLTPGIWLLFAATAASAQAPDLVDKRLNRPVEVVIDTCSC